MPPDTIRVAATKITTKIHKQVTERVLRTQNSVLDLWGIQCVSMENTMEDSFLKNYKQNYDVNL